MFVLQDILSTSLVDEIKEMENSQLTEPQQKDESPLPIPPQWLIIFQQKMHIWLLRKETKSKIL